MPGPIDSTDQTRRRHDFDLHASSTPNPARAPTPREIDPHTIVTPADQHWPPVTATSTSTSTSTSTRTPTQITLDDYRASFAGPYRVDGRSVAAPPQFRMADGYNDDDAGYKRTKQGGTIDTSNAHVRELVSICARAHAPYPGAALMGCPRPSDLVRITQALIDAGKLPAFPSDVGARIKAMQWQWGIGIDCTDYVLPAALRAAGKTMPVQGGVDYFQTADTNPLLMKVSATSARPGDVLRLEVPRKPGESPEVGHRAVVYSHAIVDPQKAASLAAKYGPGMDSFLRTSTVHVYEVDSSWGADETGESYGGVRRDGLFWNETTGQWAQINQRVASSKTPFFELTSSGPCGERLAGLYRFR